MNTPEEFFRALKDHADGLYDDCYQGIDPTVENLVTLHYEGFSSGYIMALGQVAMKLDRSNDKGARILAAELKRDLKMIEDYVNKMPKYGTH